MRFFFYGSLKSGLYNNRLLEAQGCTLVKTTKTKPEYQLYSFGPYPAMASGNKEVEVELWNVDNDDVIARIERMELGAGYHPQIIESQCGEKAWVYLYPVNEAKKYGAPVDVWPPPKGPVGHRGSHAHPQGNPASQHSSKQ